ncbi:unnamed protein product [Lymnaea stagnalis]|uniref:Glycoprotein-N-acetylgalactosamine 3-beta-galactosyltransferase 1 n=1 Tax=Lymnaea stagnalis TaxID=6523 RepID=A0AAV2HVV7_LYMST
MAKLNFFLGLCIGLSMTVIIQVFDITSTFKDFYLRNINPEAWKPHGLSCQPDSQGDPRLRKIEDDLIHMRLQNTDDGEFHQDNDVIAKQLFKTVRIACWILTSPQNLEKKAIHVKNTWTKRCNVVVFISSQKNDSFPTVGVNAKEGRQHLTAKSMQAFKYLYDHHLGDADWFLKADDDTYVIMENLRYFLSGEDPNKPLYFGQRFRPFLKQGYASGGAGYVISKEALTRYGRRGFDNASVCRNASGHEDVEMGRCLQNLGVVLKPSLDALNRTRFHCLTPETYIGNHLPASIAKVYDVENGRAGAENMSDYAISFHYVSPSKMYDLEFFIYHLRPYGILNMPQKLNLAA